MNKKEIAEIRKLFKPDTTGIDFVATAFVKLTERGIQVMPAQKSRLLTMDENEMLKYLETAKNTLGGTLEKNLLNVEFPSSECSSDGCQGRLYKLLASGLNDEDALQEFIKIVADNYYAGESIMIQIVHGMYDIPVKNKNKENLEDSDEVYDYIICSICPMVPEKPGICYDAKENRFSPLKQRLIAGKPIGGFLYPAFNDRASDLYGILFYTKTTQDVHPEFIDAMTGAKTPISADMQKKLFNSIVSTITKDMGFENTRNIHSEIRDKIDNRHLNEESTHATRNDIKDIIESVIEDVDSDMIEKAYDEIMAGYNEESLALENLVDTNKFNIGVPDIEIKVKPEKAYGIKQQMINGVNCFVIPVSGNIEVNGVPVSDK